MAEKYVRKLTRVGRRSLSLVVPAEIVDALKLREHQKLTVHRQGKEIIIRDWQ